jgi:hypothetical protein
MFDLRYLKYIIAFSLTAFLIFLAKLSHAYIFDKSPEPNVVKINLSKDGTIADFRFQVKKHFPHWFRMRFWFSENDQAERARIRELLGGHEVDKSGNPLDPGIATPVNLKIFAECAEDMEVEVYSQDIDPILTSWGMGHFGKNIGHHVLTPGTYRAQLINKQAAQELSSIRTTFEIFMPAKVDFDSKNTTTRSELCQQ